MKKIIAIILIYLLPTVSFAWFDETHLAIAHPNFCALVGSPSDLHSVSH